MMRGIDISEGSAVDFKALKAAGYDFVIPRAGWGSAKTDKQKDKDFHNNVMSAVAAGLHVGAYWFIYARTVPEAQENAIRFRERLEPYIGLIDMPVYIDYEYDSTRYYEQQTGQAETKDFATAAISAAALQMEKFGWYSGVYLNPDYIENHVIFSDLRHFTLWLAEWKDVDRTPSYQCGIWQYSGDSRIPEARGAVDLNICYQDFPAAIRKYGLNGFSSLVGYEPPASHEKNIFDDPIQLSSDGTWRYI